MIHFLEHVWAFLTYCPNPHVTLALPPLILAALIGAGLGAAKGMGPDADKERSDKNLAAVTARWSPWSGMKPGPIAYANPLGSAMQGAMAGAAMGQSNPGMFGGGGAANAVAAVPNAADVSITAPEFGQSAPGYRGLADTSGMTGAGVGVGGARDLSSMGGGGNTWGKLSMMDQSDPNNNLMNQFADWQKKNAYGAQYGQR